jgi:hypothetical protein
VVRVEVLSRSDEVQPPYFVEGAALFHCSQGLAHPGSAVAGDPQPSEAKVANEEGRGKAAPTKFTAAERDLAAGQRRSRLTLIWTAKKQCKLDLRVVKLRDRVGKKDRST